MSSLPTRSLLALSVAVLVPGCIHCSTANRRGVPEDSLALQEVTWSGNDAEITSAALSLDGALSATGDAGGGIVVWDARAGAVVRRVDEAHEGEVRALAFLPDGRRLMSGGVDGTVAVWDLLESREERRRRVPTLVPGQRPAVEAVGVASASGRVMYGSEDGAWVVEADDWALVCAIDSPAARVALSPAGDRAMTADGSDVRVWDLATGDEVSAFAASGAVSGLSFCDYPGRLLVTTGSVANVVATTTGKVVGSTPNVGQVLAASSTSGELLVTAADGTVQLLGTRLAAVASAGETVGATEAGADVEEKIAVTTLPAEGTNGSDRKLVFGAKRRSVRDVDIAGDAILVAYGPSADEPDEVAERLIALWSLRTGDEVARIRLAARPGDWSAALSPDGRWAVTASAAGIFRTNTESGERDAFPVDGDVPDRRAIAFGADGTTFATTGPGLTRLWNVETLEPVLALRDEGGASHPGQDEPALPRVPIPPRDAAPRAVALAPDGSAIVVGREGSTVVLDLATGQDLWTIPTASAAARFTPDGARLVTVAPDGAVAIVFDVASQAEVTRLEGHAGAIRALDVSADGERLATAGADGTVRVWNAKTGKELAVHAGHEGAVNDVEFDPGGTQLLSGGDDETARLWPIDGKKELVRMVSLPDGSWVAIDGEGRFNASGAGLGEDGPQWVRGLETVALEQLDERFHEPNLLAKVTGRSDEPRLEVPDLDAAGPIPSVEVLEAAGGPGFLRLAATDRGGGIGWISIYLNGKRVADDVRPEGVEPVDGRLEFEIPLEVYPAYLEDRANRIEVVAYEAKRLVSNGRGTRGITVTAAAPPAATVPEPRLYALVTGVSDYADDSLDLKYAAADAREIGRAMTSAAANLLGPDRVDVRVLVDAEVTRAAIDAELARIRESATASDIVVVYLCGHGDTITAREDGETREEYAYLLHDVVPPEYDAATTLSDRDLQRFLTEIQALKQVVMLDTCYSGRVVENLAAPRDVPESTERSLRSLSTATGTFVLSGSAADAVSFEATPFGHGLLTYSVLESLVIDDDDMQVLDTIQYAQEKVPFYAKGIGGVQKPRFIMPRGGESFPVGRGPMTEFDLKPALPLVGRSTIQSERPPFRDTLGLGRQVDRALAAASSEDSTFVFVDADADAVAWSIDAQYSPNEAGLAIQLFLTPPGGDEFTQVDVEGPLSDEPTPEEIESLARLVVAKVVETLAKP